MNISSVVKQVFGKLKLLGADSTPIGNVGDALKVAAVTTAEQAYDDTGNSSTTPLGANATFTGVAIDIKDYSSITVAAFSDVSSATDGLKMQFSPDGTNWDHQHTFSVTGNVGVSYAQSAELRYFRIVYVNGATPQTFFRLTTILKPENVSPSRSTVGQSLTSQMMADVTKSVIWGLSSSGGGTYHAVKVTPSGSATIAIGDITGVVGQNTMANSLPVTIASNQTAVPASQSGTWDINNVSGTISLPTGAATSAKQDSQITELQAIKGYVDGVETKLDTIITQTDGVEGSLSSIDTKVATAAKQPALGTAGTPSSDVLTVQGIASMTALKVDGSAVTQPVSGTVTANAGTGSFVVAQPTAANLNASVVQSGTWNINNVSGTVSLPTGAATEATSLAISGKLPATLGQKTMANGLAVSIASDQSVIPIKEEGALVSTANSTSTLLNANQTFVGTSEDVSQYGVINVVVRSDVASAVDGLDFLFSTDNVNFYSSDEYTIGAGKFKTYSFAPIARYFKIQYINGPTNQSSFLLQTIYRRNYVKPSSHRLADALSSQDDAEVTQSVLVAKLPNGEFENIRTTTEGHLIVENENNGIVDTGNSTSTPLGISGTFTGTWIDALNYASVSIIGSTDVSGTLTAEFSTDGTNIDRTLTLYSGSSIGIHNFIPVAQYVRIKYVNGGVAQSFFRLQTIFNKSGRIAMPTSRLTQDINNFTDVLNTRASLTARTPSGIYKNIETDSEGDLDVHITNPSTAFGEVSVANDTPVAQLDFVYGINTNVASSVVTGSGTATTTNSLLTLSTTAATNSSAQLTSLRYAKYRAGQGTKARFTALFTTGVAGSLQLAGMGDPALSNGFFFGYDGATFGIIAYNGGVKTFIAQSTWNYDTMDGSNSASNPSGVLLDPTKGNVYQIQMQYLGFGAIAFYIESATTGYYTLVHEIRYANANTATSVTNPAMNLLWRAQNTTNNTAISVRAGSGALFIEGMRRYLGPRYGVSNQKNATNTLTNILALRVATTYNGVTNRAQLRLRSVSATVSGNGGGAVTMSIYRNPTLGGTPAYTPINGTTADNGVTITNGQSIVSFDTAGTTVTGGTIIFNGSFATAGSFSVDTTDLDLFVNPGDVISVALVTSTNGVGGVSLNWSEDI